MASNDYYKAKFTGVADMSKPSSVLGLISRKRSEDAADRARKEGNQRNRTTNMAASSPLHVWVFGFIGAFFFGVIQPWGMDWFVSAVLGFVGTGYAAGVLAKYTIGKIILAVVGVGFAALIGYGILTAA